MFTPGKKPRIGTSTPATLPTGKVHESKGAANLHVAAVTPDTAVQQIEAVGSKAQFQVVFIHQWKLWKRQEKTSAS